MEIKEVYDIWDKFEKSDIGELKLEISGDKIEFKKVIELPDDFIATQNASLINSYGLNLQGINSSGLNLQENNTINTDGFNNSAYGDNSNNPSSNNKGYSGFEVKAPLVGTFYRASAPGEKPFVEEGSTVKKGDVIGIIEAMKLMNELVAPKDGKIESILVDDGVMVEFDQVIMSIK